MKIKILTLLLFPILGFAQTAIPNNYTKIPDTLYFKDRLYRYVIPNKKYNYWKVVRKDDTSNKKLIYENNKNKKVNDNHTIEEGFFWECLPDGCFTYIMANQNKKLTYFTSIEKLRSFIGYVDNLPEALLIARTYDLWFDRENLNGGSFRIEKDFIYLYMAKFESCPVTREAFFEKINRETGKIEYETKGIYYKGKDCYTS